MQRNATTSSVLVLFLYFAFSVLSSPNVWNAFFSLRIQDILYHMHNTALPYTFEHTNKQEIKLNIQVVVYSSIIGCTNNFYTIKWIEEYELQSDWSCIPSHHPQISKKPHLTSNDIMRREPW